MSKQRLQCMFVWKVAQVVGEAIVEPVTRSPDDLADQLRGFEAAGAAHVQLCVDPSTRKSIDWLVGVLAAFHRTR